MNANPDLCPLDGSKFLPPVLSSRFKGDGLPKPTQEPFAVIREAMASQGKVALGRLVMAQRERIVAIEARGRGLALTTLHSHDEVRSEEDAFQGIADVKVDTRMVEIAKQIIAQANGDFEPSLFVDRYQVALREMVEAKAGGQMVHRPVAARADNVVDLMEALRRSLKGDAPARGPTPEEQAPARKAARTAQKLGKGAEASPPAANPRRKLGSRSTGKAA